MSLEKLKDTARKFEQKEDWRKAIETYAKAIQQMESGREAAPDLSLYNRIGDLYLKINDTQAAVRHYERAVDLYADQGFFNNAIALCGKVLRVNPGRTQTYLKLAQLHARKNVVIEAKRNLLEFIERMNAQGQLDDAFGAVKDFADQFSGSQEIRLMLVELLRASQRAEEAHEQLDKLCTELEATGDVSAARRTRERLERDDDDGPRYGGGDLIFLDTGSGFGSGSGTPPSEPAAVVASDPEPVSLLESSPPTEPPAPAPAEELFLAEPLVVEPPAPASELLGGLETHHFEPVPQPGADAPLLEGIQIDDSAPLDSEPLVPLDLDIERSGTAEFGSGTVSGLEPGELTIERSEGAELVPDIAPASGLDLSSELDASLQDTLRGAPPPPEPSMVELALRDAAGSEPAVAPDPGSADDIARLEQAVVERPEDPDAHRRLAEVLLRAGEIDRARQELEIVAHTFETGENWEGASEAVGLLVTLTPGEIRYHQKLVEFAYRSGSKPRLIEAYLALADALVEVGEPEKAEAVYQRVVDHEPENERARSALAELASALGAPAPETPTSPPHSGTPGSAGPARAGFVDLGSLIMDDGSRRRDTRMRIQNPQPTEDEQRNFEETLAAFKRGIEENVELEDYHTHYDLGVAFKEMGLLDEAIAEFQKALRSPEGRLRTAEALGTAFFDKGQFAVAENLLRRAVETLAGGDDDKIGLLYWLGRAREAQGKGGDALGAYERALAVDIRFMDLGERVQRLGAGRS
jgi:tetratricopeptide (TPR) repeat protein